MYNLYYNTGCTWLNTAADGNLKRKLLIMSEKIVQV